ncbi:MAG: alpha/beta fold hydrolase [Alphaproteobacteria bacterium]|jgi:pimeloyl-ACP methyl ester carboxylesterase|nr:alpha/beta fold hydrolase [Alphaproteobacteria bacterium]
MRVLFVHGVPDTPAMWSALIEALALPDEAVLRPALPGFGTAPPAGFRPTKEAYVDWLIDQAQAAGDAGPLHLVGHDWGALLVLRAASLRPDLFASWAVSNALIDGQYRGHMMARLWATPLVGELVMAGMREGALARALADQGLPEALARHEAAQMDATMKRCILGLYRSARGLRLGGDWESGLENLPPRGLILWGEEDPYVPIATAERFSRRWNYPLHVEHGAGHWAVVERAEEMAEQLRGFWRPAPPSP